MSWIYSFIFASIAFVSSGTAPESELFTSGSQAPELHQSDIIERFDQTYPLNPNGRVSLSNINGSVEVMAWDRNEVRVEATKTADSAETLALMEVKIRSTPERLSIDVDLSGARAIWRRNDVGRKAVIDFKISVPRNAIVNEVETVNGSVSVANLTSFTKISAVNGTITARNLRGNANLSTVNGDVNCEFDRADAGTKIALNTVNGRVNLTLPSDINATLKADTLNGNIVNDFGLPVRKGEYVGRDLYGRIGTGEVDIKLDSVNGQLSILRKNDGRSPNPAVNLLPASGTAAIAVSRQEREQAVRSARAARQNAEQAMKQAEKEIEKIKPEIENLKLIELESLKSTLPTVISTGVTAGIKAAAESVKMLQEANWTSGPPTIEKRSNAFSVEGKPTVTIDAAGCDVNIRGTNDASIRYVLTQISRDGRRADPEVDEQRKGSNVRLIVNGADAVPFQGIGGMRTGFRLEVFVPKRSDIVITTDAEVRVTGLNGSMIINAEDAPVSIRDSSGDLKINAADAQVRVVAYNGGLITNTENGLISLDGSFSSIRSHAEGGSIYLTVPQNAGATIRSNRELSADGVPLIRDPNKGEWRIGSGEAMYEFLVENATINIRNSVPLGTN
ncbi:DUF4097 family beta strand repeat-containing protein [Leptolyngbya sp. 7M]|uniref:DUF4097 family beta strand repeat-containing protein n=1 Tax=Leptolyngbya sp. 7M TaxID=2812896 RepID=UPI001B8CF8C0|nr:DUF4097 family beta strand repeat-containing protein [Leptolyngbya sp. 7M]QYO66959.1 DUF4097 family beta strand repeat-containing protein [Leptolyngbya sp. 7M]